MRKVTSPSPLPLLSLSFSVPFISLTFNRCLSGYVGFVGKDPVTDQIVRSGELTKATPAEVAECLKQYNEVDGEDDTRPKDGGIGKGDAAGTAGDTPATNNLAFGSSAELSHNYKNSEGRMSNAAPVASAGSAPHRQNGRMQLAG